MEISKQKMGNKNDIDMVNIFDARNQKERLAVYRFRYQIQVNEMRRKIPYADHRRQILFDELDGQSLIAYAEHKGKVVGTARIVLGGADDFPEDLARIFHLECYKEYEPGKKNICFATKLMIDPQYRKTPLSYRLMGKAYELARQNKVQYSFSGSNPYLIPMYEQLGYRQIGPGFQDPGYGFIIPTLLLTEDIEHLHAVRSPYLRIARKFSNSSNSKKWLEMNIPDIWRYPVGIFMSEDDRWNQISRKIGNPIDNIPVLNKLELAEAKMLLHQSAFFECGKRQQFIRRGDVCNELNILIDGEMAITNAGGKLVKAKPGDVIGAQGLLNQNHHKIDASATSDCKVLAISRFVFGKLSRVLPGLANKLDLEQSDVEVEDNEKQCRSALG